MKQDPVDFLIGSLAAGGAQQYHGEPVSQLEHALQSADLAVRAGASHALVVAALLHDIGHLVHTQGEHAAEQGLDTVHERLGAAVLEPYFGPEVVEPVRLHVAAKRFLCATDPHYKAALSAASLLSLQLQGGPMSGAELAAFRANPQFEAAVQLRRWDDEAKVPGLAVPGLEAYRDMIAQLVRRDEQAGADSWV